MIHARRKDTQLLYYLIIKLLQKINIDATLTVTYIYVYNRNLNLST